MSDDDDKPKTGRKPRPKRDPNKPFPKRAARKSKVIKAILAGVFVLASVWVVTYSMQIGKPPWEWGGEDASGFVDYSKQQVSEAKDQLGKIDWGKLGEKTKQLWNKVPELEQKLERKLAELGEKRKKKSGVGEAASGEDGGDEPPAAVEAPPSELELGCEAMRDGVRHYRKAMNSQAELKKARARFEVAQKHFEAAQSLSKDDADRQEISGYLQENQKYLYDCVKLEKVGG